MDGDDRQNGQNRHSLRVQHARGIDSDSAAGACFRDSGNISSWALTGVGYVSAKGIMSGVGDNRFDPQGKHTREQAIVTFARLLEK